MINRRIFDLVEKVSSKSTFYHFLNHLSINYLIVFRNFTMIAKHNYCFRLLRFQNPRLLCYMRSLGGAMKSYRKELWFEVPTRRALINITSKVEACLRESGIKEGLGAGQGQADLLLPFVIEGSLRKAA